MSCSTLCLVDLTALFYLYQSLISQLHDIRTVPRVYSLSDSGGFLHISRCGLREGKCRQTLAQASHWEDQVSCVYVPLRHVVPSVLLCSGQGQISATLLLRMRNVSDRSCRDKTNIMFSNFYHPPR